MGFCKSLRQENVHLHAVNFPSLKLCFLIRDFRTFFFFLTKRLDSKKKSENSYEFQVFSGFSMEKKERCHHFRQLLELETDASFFSLKQKLATFFNELWIDAA